MVEDAGEPCWAVLGLLGGVATAWYFRGLLSAMCLGLVDIGHLQYNYCILVYNIHTRSSCRV